MSANHPLSPESHEDPQRKTVLNLYAALAVSLILGLTPNMMMALVAFLFLTGVLIASYRIRKSSEAESLAENHAIYIIRTIWIGGLLALITTTIGGIMMVGQIDYTPFNACADTLAAQGMDFAANAGYQDIWNHTSPCMDEFLAINRNRILSAGLVTVLPVLLYFAVRFVRGLSRAIKGYRIANPHMWH